MHLINLMVCIQNYSEKIAVALFHFDIPFLVYLRTSFFAFYQNLSCFIDSKYFKEVTESHNSLVLLVLVDKILEIIFC
jgi:hypothetical protein